MAWIGLMLPMTILATTEAPGTTEFLRFPATATTSLRPVAPRLMDALSHRYRSALRKAARSPVDFAGHYVLAQIGCGADCLQVAAIDRLTGQVTWFPATISGWPLSVAEPLAFRRDSRLLIVRGMINERPPAKTRKFLFDRHRFVPLAVAQRHR